MKSGFTSEKMSPAPATSGLAGVGGFAFAAAVVFIAALMLLDRVGAPERLLIVLAPGAALAALAAIGLSRSTMRISQFFAAGRAVSGSQGAMVLAALLLGLMQPFAPPQPGLLAGRDLLAGLALGAALAALATGPLLRKSGAFSLAELLSARFPALPLRLAVVALVAAIGGLVLLTGLDSAVATMTSWLGLPRVAACLAAGLLLLAIGLPGGSSGLMAAASGAFGLALLALALPLAAHVWAGGALPLPLVGERALMSEGLERLAQLGGAAATESVEAVAVSGIGLAVLALICGPFAGSRDAGAARRGGLGGLVWSAALLALALAGVLVALAALDKAAVGQRPGQLPLALAAAAGRGYVEICGVASGSPAELRAACAAKPGFAGVLRQGDVAPQPGGLLLAQGAARPGGTALSAASAAAMIALGLALAAAGLQALVVALGNDLFHRLRDRAAPTSRRLAAVRILMVLAALGGAAMTALRGIDAREALLLATDLLAAFAAPLLLLALWPLASARDAVLGLAAGGAALVYAGGLAPVLPQPRAVLMAAGATLAAGLLASLLHRRPRPFSSFARDLLRSGDALPPDKGA